MLNEFFDKVSHPFVIVGQLLSKERASVKSFLLRLNVPCYLEATSGLREDVELAHLRIANVDDLFSWPVDGILRLGGVPTIRAWRDLEKMEGEVEVLSLSRLPFAGLSWGKVAPLPFDATEYQYSPHMDWVLIDKERTTILNQLYVDLPTAEPACIHHLSKLIPSGSFVYLGNSLPIREWNLAATSEDKALTIEASRGLNGIDGQISTFLGLCTPGRQNFAILGDLTTLYDMAGPWIIPQLPKMIINIVVVNNSGGQIFSHVFPQKCFQNPHKLSFKPLAEMWGLTYNMWKTIPIDLNLQGCNLIEVVPDPIATKQFYERKKSCDLFLNRSKQVATVTSAI